VHFHLLSENFTRYNKVYPANTMLHVTYMLVVISYSAIYLLTYVLCNNYIVE